MDRSGSEMIKAGGSVEKAVGGSGPAAKTVGKARATGATSKTSAASKTPKTRRPRNAADASPSGAAVLAEKSTNLDRYHAKRDFRKTAEPEGRVVPTDGYTYIIQKHEASHLHYDFRLELDGTLKSWAVPKGPSYDPHDKRLAMEVEDHPVDYATFEGVIPQGEYGGGTVMLWDRGTWQPVGDPHVGLSAGKLVFRLNGERMQGEWTLVRFHGKEKARTGTTDKDDGRHQWFLIKHRDEFVRDGDAGKFTADNSTSIISGRTMLEIAADKDLVWKNNAAHGGAPAAKQQRQGENETSAAPTATTKFRPRAKRGVRGAHDAASISMTASRVNVKLNTKTTPLPALPDFIEPQLATLSDAMPTGAQWLHEVKFDGYRMLTYIENGAARMMSRNDKDWTAAFAEIADFSASLPVQNAIMDGEVICMDADGKSNFSQLKNALADGRADGMQYYVFDLLYLDGIDLRALPLIERKAKLAAIIEQLPPNAQNVIQFSAEFSDDSGKFFQSVCSMQLEGVISKRADAPYLSGRGRTWLKTKCLKREEFVVGGFTLPSNGSDGIGALLLGYFEDGTLHYAGRVGTGWNAATSVRLRKVLEPRAGASCPFAAIEPAARRHAHWVTPELVCEVQFTEWTPDGHLRHPSFQGLREDKAARDVGRDRAVPLAKATKDAAAQVGRANNTRSAVGSAAGAAAAGAAADDAPEGAATAGGVSANGVTVGGVRISHPERIVFPDVQMNKQQLAEYYLALADKILPYIARRPISMLRCPGGVGETCFFQRHLGLGNSPHLHELVIPVKGADHEYLMIEDVDGLLALVQWGVIEIHPWQCTAKKLDKPDQMIFDLDPDNAVSWDSLIEGAFEVRARMEELGLTAFIKTTGGKGLHVVVPMAPVYEWDTIKAFTRLIAQSMEEDSPEKYLSRMTKAARKGRIFVDYLRNDITATAVAPFSVRARAGATVSTPLNWNELTSGLNVADFTIESVSARVAKQKSDPWAGFFDVKQKIQKKHLKALNINA